MSYLPLSHSHQYLNLCAVYCSRTQIQTFEIDEYRRKSGADQFKFKWRRGTTARAGQVSSPAVRIGGLNKRPNRWVQGRRTDVSTSADDVNPVRRNTNAPQYSVHHFLCHLTPTPNAYNISKQHAKGRKPTTRTSSRECPLKLEIGAL